jgi:hypothetical protein
MYVRSTRLIAPARIRLQGLAFAVLGAASIPFIKHRTPVAKFSRKALHGHGAQDRRKMDLTFLRRSTFICFSGCILVTSFSSFLPSLWLPTYSDDVQSTPNGTALLSIMNGAARSPSALASVLL